MKGFILAAGEGTRLYPVVLEIPKPLLTVNKIPVLTYLVELYLKHGIDDIKINVQRKHIDDFQKWKILYFAGEKIDFIIEEKPSGTFGPLSKVGADWFSEPIVVSNGDELKDINLKKMVDWHRRRGALVTIGLVRVADPQAYGVARMNGDKIVEFIEKPEIPPSDYINSGTYVMEPGVRGYFPPRARYSMVELDLFPRLAREERLYGYKVRGKWRDIGTFERWEEAIKKWHHQR